FESGNVERIGEGMFRQLRLTIARAADIGGGVCDAAEARSQPRFGDPRRLTLEKGCRLTGGGAVHDRGGCECHVLAEPGDLQRKLGLATLRLGNCRLDAEDDTETRQFRAAT